MTDLDGATPPPPPPTSGETTRKRRRLWPEPWASHAATEADSVEHRMRMAVASEPLDPRRAAAVRAIEGHLAAVRQATRSEGRLRRRGPFDRWRGTSVELAYRSLHAAKVFLVDLLAPEELDALIPCVTARVATCLQPEEIRRLKLDTLATATVERKRAGLRQAMEVGYDASDQLYARVRGFRNILLSAAALIAIFIGALALIVSRAPDAMPLCFTPTVTSAQPTTGQDTRNVCPSGEDPRTPVADAGQRQEPQPGDVLIVAGLGLLGGALAGAFSIRKIRGTATPYDIPIAVAWLKVPSGALTAVAGILLLGGGFVPGLSELDSQRQILAYALVLGYAQQLATRFIDDRAQTLLNSVPSKDPEAKQPIASVQTTTPAAGPEAPPVESARAGPADDRQGATQLGS